MAKGWTKEERKKHLRERTHETREKVIVLGVLFLIVIIFLAAIYYSFVYRLNPSIPIILIIALFAVIVFATFFVDFIFYESQ
jgi:sterol desaturase/sphingolipid hydroxylase (fatty acid hydroxylase superfamily)